MTAAGVAEAEIAGEITEPGVYDGLDEAAYHADPVPGGSLSASGAKLLLPPSCPALYRYRRDHPKVSAEFDFGTAAHKYVLGTGAEIAVVNVDDWRTKGAREVRDEIRASGRTPLLVADHDKAEAMAAAIREHPVASALLDPGRGKPEQSLFWQDDATGIWCRARLDWLPHRDPARRFIIADYKGLALDTPLPTPEGWTTMGAVQIGDRLLDSAGRPCAVIAKSAVHQRQCYRIRFDDRSEVICDDEHLWVTEAGGRQNRTHVDVRSTEHIRRTLRLYGQCHHRVQVAGALELPAAELPIDPYVLGCWLGDGTAAAGRISSADVELFGLIAQRGYECSRETKQASGKCPTRTVYGLAAQLRKADLLGHKAVPGIYLRAGRDQRLDLLRGLMDTDGSWNPLRQQAIFTTVDKALACAVRELACSLGQRAVIHEYTASGFGRTIQAYRVTFTPVRGLNPFALPRKASRVAVRSEVRSRQRVIISVEDMPAVPTQCIAVDSPDRTYLCTEAMIPTHNTAAAADPASIRKAVANYGYFMQAAWYAEGVRVLGLDPDPAFLFIFQEKTPPYLVTVAQLDAEATGIGRARNMLAREMWRDCTQAGVWPGYTDEIELISLPPWAARQLEGEYLT